MLSEVLRLQHEYVSTNSPAMQARGLLIRDDIPGQLRAWLSDRKSPPSTEGRDGTGRKTRVPWVRIFDPLQSPSATDGWYVVFLFAADGSAVYLSLNQGTTDFVNGEFRAKSEEVLEARVLAARSLVSDQASSSWNPPLETDMQLHDVGSLGEGYERGNVVARRYDADAIPDEGVLRDDLTRMLDLLSVVQEADLGRSDSPGPLEETSANPAREINPVSKGPEPADASKDFEWLLSQTLWGRPDLEEIVDTIEERRPQVVLAGPPGTGKTWVAESIALYLTQGRKDSVRTVQFHPTYGYEDFVEGLRPVAGDEGNVVFDTVEGTLVEIADHARRVDHPVVLVIDEMNRANLPSVFGELLYLLEYRDKTISLLHRDEFSPREPQDYRHDEHRRSQHSEHRLGVTRRFDIFDCPPTAQSSTVTTAPMSIMSRISPMAWRSKRSIGRIPRSASCNRPHVPYEAPIARSELKRTWNRQIFPLVEEYFFDQPDIIDLFKLDEFWPHLTCGQSELPSLKQPPLH